ncbi:hypothetical protein B0T25DRAFT_28323 [Lasiosphaeria hispida]|uniref:Methyltransferase type 11 domain-containing protein n=1 Tax=Lasiosphaeria hispida TaxID=260671 RepID=A0AAJ0HUR1_9PEZI|nr:hypothetical protein B0T25DRAFT_28323 [Lasiosphaeria hispida]
MADLVLLPNNTYRPPSPQGRRRRTRTLNPIMEEPEQQRGDTAMEWRRRNRQSTEKIEQWLSPLSDHFPTPRGMHFLAAPIMPQTPSFAASDSDGYGDVDDASSDASSNPSTKMWNNRESIGTDVTDFDDIYDVSDDEIQRKERLQANGIGRQRSSTRSSRSGRRVSRTSVDSRKALTPLVIPEHLESMAIKKTMSPIPPTPPSAVTMSPAIKTLMELRQAQELPRISAPPSLDGSMNSEEMAAMSAPPTPMIGASDNVDPEWSGVHLQPGALETLHALSGSDSEYDDMPEQVIEVPQEMSETQRQLPRLLTGIARAPSAHRQSMVGLSKLDIPSPGGFFSELSSASRRTWHSGSQADESNPPTSTTAENFYKAPWAASVTSLPPPPPRPLNLENQPSTIVERVLEIPDDNLEDLPTAFRIEPTPVPITARRVPPVEVDHATATSETAHEEPASLTDVNEIVLEYDPDYVAEQQDNVQTHVDRTELWLMAQRSYLQGVVGFSEEGEAGEEAKLAETESESEEKPEPPPKDAPAVTSPQQKKKAVRFSEANIKETIPRNLPSKLSRMESAYYRAFTDATVKSCHTDVFVNRQPRFEALQAQRVSLKEGHRNQLLGKYQLSVVPQSAKKRMSTNVARGDDVFVDDPEKLRADKEHDALGQMSMATWHVAATKLLNGGRLIAAPVAKRLARQSRMAPTADGVSRDRARILDLGGQGSCDWAWHAALQYPNTKIYTVTTKAIRQLSNSNIRGPPNHRQVAVDRLTKLPFSDDQFDLVSARELHAVLKLFGENGTDEWEACLKECIRVLKPGGYLEFSVLDADIMNAGPLSNAKAVEFGFALQTLGYDPNPTRSFLGRLQNAGFDDVRRAWMCLPVGPKRPVKQLTAIRDSAGLPVQTLELEAIVSGSSDNVAAITGMAAGWSWERWLLRAEMEKAAGELRLADTVTPGEAMREAGKMIADVHSVVEEGREIGSGFRMLRGYARKPRPGCLGRCGTIKMVLDMDSLL